ncbi:MAG: type II toxin-antitoxin system TacA family antitoxin, partial [Planctomycetota bacterium]
IEVRLSPAHKELIEHAAALNGQSISAFVVAEALERARQIQFTLLSRRDWDRFLEVMDRDGKPAPALVAAARKRPRRKG